MIKILLSKKQVKQKKSKEPFQKKKYFFHKYLLAPFFSLTLGKIFAQNRKKQQQQQKEVLRETIIKWNLVRHCN